MPRCVTRQDPLQRERLVCTVWHGKQQVGRSLGPQSQLTSSCIWIGTGVQVPVFEFNMHQLSISCSNTRHQSTPCCTKRSLCCNCGHCKLHSLTATSNGHCKLQCLNATSNGHCKLHSLNSTSKVSINRSMLTDQGSSGCIRQTYMHSKIAYQQAKLESMSCWCGSSTLQAEAQQKAVRV